MAGIIVGSVTYTILLAVLLGATQTADAPIAVQGAVDTELTPLIEALGNPEPRTIHGYHFWEGAVAGRRVVVSRTEVGMVHAAVATTLLIREFEPSVILNQGTAGAVDPDLRVGDIVLGAKSAPFGAVRTANREHGRGVELDAWEPLPRLLRQGDERVPYTEFVADTHLLSTAKSTPYQGGRLIEGTVGSADQWNREIDKLLWAHETFGIASEDMESAAVHQTAQIFGVPFLAIRIISNSEHSDPEFRRELGLTCARYVLDVVKALADD